MDAQLSQVVQLLTEQNELLKRHLWRFRFSLLALLILMTLTCGGLGFVSCTQQKSSRIAPYPAAGSYTLSLTQGSTQPKPILNTSSVPGFNSSLLTTPRPPTL